MGEIVVVGAGVAGLTAGYLLSKKGFKVTVLEKEDSVGGLARSYYYDGFIFDIGPHRFHTDDKEVLKFIEEVLGKNKIVLPRSSGVWMFGGYHDWPLNWRVIFKLPIPVILRIIPDLLSRKEQKSSSFEDYIISRYGRTLYDVFFKPYTEKFLKLPPEKVHSNWAEAGIDRAVIDKKVKMGSLLEVIKTSLLPKPVKTDFLYPSEGGIDMFSKKLAKGIEENGGEVIVKSAVEKIESEESMIKSVSCRGKNLHPENVIWTAPLPALLNLLNLSPADLRYLSIVLFNIEVQGISKTGYQWCYYGQHDTTINRVSVPVLFSKQTAPEGQTGLCVEVTCYEGDEVWKNPESLIETVIDDLIKVKLIEGKKDIGNITIEKVLNTYPVYDIDYPGKLEKALGALATFKNLKLLGRTGTFWYNNMDHSIRKALDLAMSISGSNPDEH
jgi:protoporphyrinogen oxidase